MKTSNFFSLMQIASGFKSQVLKHSSMESILSHPKPGSLVILDIDDTIGRVSQTIGLDAWFRFRIQQYANDGHAESQALANTIEIYNQVQLASTRMLPVDTNINIAGLIKRLKDQGSKVIALTARNHVLTEKTLSLLETMNVNFSDDVLSNGCLSMNNKPVVIKNGVIFANGNNKGHCLEHVQEKGHFTISLFAFNSVTFIDDSEKNCNDVLEMFTRINIPDYSVWHYNYAEMHLPFQELEKSRSALQETHLLTHHVLLTDEEADQQLCI